MMTEAFITLAQTVRVRWTWIAFLSVTLIGVFARLYLLFLRPIQLFDESYYLANTVGLLRYGSFPPFGWNPGVALVNALLYLPVQNLALGLDYASRTGMFISGIVVFGMIGVATWMLTHKSAYVVFALAFTLASAPFWNVTNNSSNNYYGATLMITLVLLFHTLPKPTTSGWWSVAATSIALGATMRNDGLLVLAATSLIYVWNCWRESKHLGVTFVRFAVRWMSLPTLIIVLFLIPFWRDGAFYDGFTGTVSEQELMVTERTYSAFVQGAGWVQRFELQSEGKRWWEEGYRLADDKFGSPAENDISVFRAILRNPFWWAIRVYLNTRDFFLAWHGAYLQTALPVVIMTMWGGATLLRRQRYHALAILLLLFPTLAYFLLSFWNERYIINLTPLWTILVTYSLATIGDRTAKPGWKTGIVPVISVLFTLLLFKALDRPASEVVPIAPITLWISVLLFIGALLMELIRPSEVIRQIAISVFAVLLLIGVFRPLPQETLSQSSYQKEMQQYLLDIYPEYGAQPVCLDSLNIDSKSLIWYARQSPEPLNVGSLVVAAQNGELAPLLAQNGCRYALHVGVTDLSPIVSSPDYRVLYRSKEDRILFFELSSAGGE